MKQRFSSLDVKVIAHELSASLVTLRVSNIYDLSSRIFLFKFAKPEHREQLLVESGYRCHLSDFARSTAAAPSAFVSRLRKFLKTRRVTSVRQVGTDRVIEISFSDGLYHLLLEFYAGGNIILTDNEYNIIALLRTVSEGAEHEQFRVGSKYELEQRQNYNGVPPLTKERVKDGLRKAVDRAKEAEAQNKKFKRKPGDALRKALATSITEYPPILLDHSLEKTGFDKNLPPTDVIADESLLDKLMLALEEAKKTVEQIVSAHTAKGYILAKGKAQSTEDQTSTQDSKAANAMYDDFHPFRPCQFEGKPDLSVLEFEGFNKTVDEFYSSIEGQKLESKLQERELNAKRKLANARSEHDKRIDGLQQVQELNVQRAQAIEANLDRVEEARAAVNGLVAQGMDWKDIEKLIEMEQGRGNAVAQTVKLPLKLHENTATLLLAGYGVEEEEMADESDYELSDSDDDTVQKKSQPVQDNRLAVDIDLAESAWANSRQYYDQRRVAASKQDRTQQASVKALKSTEQKINADLKKGLQQEKAVLRPVRKQLWFEKFIWFVSSDGYLVLCGKDAQQNEILYRRHLKKGDVYVHADLPGAATVIIKNNPSTPDAPIPPSTLSQAGNLSVCTSNAWDSKAIMSAWWVNADQVTKIAATGEYLDPGNFLIRGEKNFLPPAQLLLGFAVLFQINEESKARHKKHRLTQPAEVPEATDDKQDNTGEKKTSPDNEDGDDDFPDANVEGSDDDDFPDVDKKSVNGQNNEEKDTQPSDDDSEQDEDGRGARFNPLQPKGISGKKESSADTSDVNDELEDHQTPGANVITDTEHGDVSNKPENSPGIKHLSVAARRKLKKGGQTDDDNDSSALEDDQKSTKSSQPASKPAQTTRGKRGKAKKIAQKYADQDEEDRALAMALLGSRKAKDDKTSSDAPETGSKETAEEARARRREQHAKAQKAGLEAEEMRRLNLDEGGPAADEDEAATESLTSILDGLVGTPLPGDEILEAIPVCAPWAALGRYKYKAKIQPGAQKKGKAVREVLGRWVRDGQEGRKVDNASQDTERIWPREAELLRGWKETEIVGVVPVKTVRVMMAGGGEGAKKGGSGGKGKGGGRGGRGKKR
ncbi:hypothetical protein K461DRAFT_226458 [Myriangium duriaei CBS 260.36]|uniref:Ribosome quality control complex subunit 2 n=1 Tax=Myriangium duriaei CBS 260.36 TaxID=1168546 RepID=A0A9P4MGZ8_9PEZI|nr:hypothetical protein K461DRAFT_226458 [Myriangium duriaei CBS 260.36]